MIRTFLATFVNGVRPIRPAFLLCLLVTLATLLGGAQGCSSGGGSASLFFEDGGFPDGAFPVDSGGRDGSSVADAGRDAARPDASVDAAIPDAAPTDANAGDASLLPTLSVNDVSRNEGSSGTTSMTFAVSLSTASAQTVTVNYATAADGTATTNALIVGGADFIPTSGALTFAPGDLSKNVTVLLMGDSTSEVNETFSLVLSSAVNATIAGSGTGTIVDDDSAPAISVSDALLIEGNGGTPVASFVITLSASSGKPVSVFYKTTDGTATAPADYAAIGLTSLSFAPGETTKNVSVNVVGDLLAEANETFTVDLSNPTNAVLGKGVGTATIQDNDGVSLPALSIGDPTITEGNSGTKVLAFPVTLSTTSAQAITVDFATEVGTANGADFQATAGTLSIPASTLNGVINVVINGDTSNEDDETFTVTLANSQGALIQKAQGLGTITNDDAAPTVSIGNASVAEGQAGTSALSFTVTLSAASGKSVSVDYGSTDGTATNAGSLATGGQDYTAAGGTIVFPAGTTSQQIIVAVAGDGLNEANETLTVALSNPSNATVGTSQATGTIVNDDALPNLVIANASGTEGNAGTTDLVFQVSLVDGSGNPVSSGRTITVSYQTSNGSAAAGSDYSTATGTLTFNPGQTQQAVAVSINGDTVAEVNETFSVIISAPNNATITSGTAAGTINNDDGSLPFLNVSDATVIEGNSGTAQLSFTVTLTPAAAQTVTVDYATVNGTAVSGQDFTQASGTLTFAVGETSKPVVVTVSGDTLSEVDEGLVLALSNASASAAIQDGSGSGTITNDDAAPSLSIADGTTSEGNSGAKVLTFAVSLSAVSGRTVTVAYSTADGSATTAGAASGGGSDYVAGSGTVTFAAGEITKNIAVTVNGDTTREDDETFAVTVASPVGASIADANAAGTITNDDAFPMISIGNVTAAEGTPAAGAPGTTAFAFSVSLSAGYQGTVTVRYSTANGTATFQSNDYTRYLNETLTFLPGETVKVISVLVQKDTATESNETFSLQLSNASPGGVTIADAEGTGTITNDD